MGVAAVTGARGIQITQYIVVSATCFEGIDATWYIATPGAVRFTAIPIARGIAITLTRHAIT